MAAGMNWTHSLTGTLEDLDDGNGGGDRGNGRAESLRFVVTGHATETATQYFGTLSRKAAVPPWIGWRVV